MPKCIDCNGMAEPTETGFSKRCEPCWRALPRGRCAGCSSLTQLTRYGFAYMCDSCYEAEMQAFKAEEEERDSWAWDPADDEADIFELQRDMHV